MSTKFEDGDEFQLYDAIVENMAEGVFLIRMCDGIIVYANPTVERLFGYSHGELQGKYSSVLAFPTDKSPEEITQAVMESLKANGVWQGEVKNIKKDGTAFWCYVNISTFEHPHYGEVWIAINQDITERKQAEQALTESERRFSALFEAAPDAIFLADPASGEILDANQSACRLLAKTRQEIIGMHQSELHPPLFDNYSKETFDQHITESQTQGYTHPVENVVLRSDGVHIPVEVTAQTIKLHDRSVLMGVFRDITERKQAEEELRESEERLRLLVENSPYCVHEINDKGQLISMNPAGLKMIGVQNEAEIRGVSYIATVADKDQERVGELFMRSLQGYLSEFEFQASNGRIFQSNFVPIKAADGSILRLMGLTQDITERKQAEEAVRNNESLYRKMNENSPLGMHFYKLNEDDQLIFMGANPAADKLLGVDNSQFIGKRIEDAFPPLAQTEVPHRYHDAATKGDLWLTEQIIYEDDQIKGAFEVRAFQTTPGNMVAVFSDITNRKQAEEALRASEERYRALVENQPSLICRWLPDTTLTFVNQAYCDFFGRKRDELLGKPWLVLLPENERDGLLRYCEQLALHPIATQYEHHAIVANGDYRWQAWIDIPIFDPSGKFLEIQSVGRDITERKQAEKALRESEEKYRDIFENAIEGIFQSTPDGRFSSVNAAMARIFGYETPDEMITSVGNHISTRIYAHPDYRCKFINALDQHGAVADFEAENLRKDGSIIWTKTNARVIWNTDGTVLYYEGFLEDITKRKRAEDEVRKANEALKTQLDDIQSLQETLRDQATRDSLTGLYNRRYLYETLERELARAKREKISISVVMIDIDHFKDFNDAYGHQAGDEVLIALGGLLHKGIRQGDIACRYGGEEFVLIMPGADNGDAERRVEAIRHDFNNLRIIHDGVELFATISVGIAFYPQHGADMNEVIKASDIALYEAKRAGRNRVHIRTRI